MEAIRGTSPSGRPRELDIEVTDRNATQAVRLHIHPPGPNREGWEVYVSADELRAALQRLGVG